MSYPSKMIYVDNTTVLRDTPGTMTVVYEALQYTIYQTLLLLDTDATLPA